MNTVDQIEIAWKLYSRGVGVGEIALSLSVHRATVYRWIAGIKRAGCLRSFLKRYASAKKRARVTRIHPHAEILLKEQRRKTGYCGQKLVFWLKKKHGISLSVAHAYRLLKKHFVLSSKWRKWVKRPKLPQVTHPNQVIQMDGIDFGGIWVHTFVDCYTRRAHAVAVLDKTAASAAYAAEQAAAVFGSILWLQTDNGSEYGPSFDILTKGWYLNRRRIHPGCSNENGFVESFNRTVRKECLGWGKYRPEQQTKVQARLNAFLLEYHTERPHLSLNFLTPNEFMLK